MNNNDVLKTLDALRKAGDTGVHSFELNRIVGTTRAAARVRDLRKQGYSITSKREQLGDAWGVRYFLTSSPVHESPLFQQKPIRWEFDMKTYTARPIYA